MAKYLALDIEIAALIPDGEQDWKQYRPLGITCAAIAFMSSEGEMFAYPFWGSDLADKDKSFAARMSRYECAALVKTLQTAIDDGFTLLTHNGVSFDFDVLAEESGMHAECVELAMSSVDTMLHFFCEKGYPVGLDAVCKGLGLAGKTEGVSGALAPAMWANGQYQEVLDYCANDAKMTLQVALDTEGLGRLYWHSKAGKRNSMPLKRWLTAREALSLPLPNTDWMTGDRLTREKFTEWMNKSPG